jgi:hypothetical protein
MKRKRMTKSAAIVLSGILAASMAVPVQAFAGSRPLKTIKTIRSYDITGDGKKDTIRVKARKDRQGGYQDVTVYINGKKKYSNPVFGCSWSVKVSAFRLKNKKVFLAIDAKQDNDCHACRVLQYKKGKLHSVLNGYKVVSIKGNDAGDAVYTGKKGNTVTMRAAVVSPTIGNYSCYVKYKYKNGAFHRTANTHKVYNNYAMSADNDTKDLKVQSKIRLYTKPGKPSSRQLVPGDTVRINAVHFAGRQTWYRAKVSGKNYWIKGITNKKYYAYQESVDWEQPGNGMFSNIVMAG